MKDNFAIAVIAVMAINLVLLNVQVKTLTDRVTKHEAWLVNQSENIQAIKDVINAI